ncbi:PucR family transcriptional regulator [Leucobacter edaphi]|uniref:PucR family transcriptional regulator n=1 Tax=Leucobacter edaphi TaxID=2796472 RepID=UPI0034E28193
MNAQRAAPSETQETQLDQGFQPGGTSSPTIPLGELLHQYQLGLVTIAGNSADAGDRPVQWVHASELNDPTPFLTPRTVLLTTGARFDDSPDQADADDFVARLIDAGVTALGVGIGLHWDRVPMRFVSACDRLGLPLFRVPYDTAFIEIVQTAARLIDAEERARDLWSLEAQRAVSNAALHRDGLGAVVSEAASRLGRWVCITDRSGRIVESAGLDPSATEWLRREARRLVSRGASAARIEDDRGAGARLQTLGRQRSVLGVLAISDDGTPDSADRALLGLVSALATIQLEHRAGIDTAQAALRTGIVRLLVEGETRLAGRLAASTLVRLPDGPIVAARYADSDTSEAFEQDLRSLDAGSAGLFAATLEGTPLLIAEARHLPAIRRLFGAHGVPGGVSERGRLAELDALIQQAERAYEHASAHDGSALVAYVPTLHDGVLSILDASQEAHRRAAMLLAPIRQHDQRHGDRIEEALRVWLTHHGQTSPAASELGIHRHTLKARVQTGATLLQSDFDNPDTRAELWTALRLSAPDQLPGQRTV